MNLRSLASGISIFQLLILCACSSTPKNQFSSGEPFKTNENPMRSIAQTTQVMQCGTLRGLVGEAAPQIVSDENGLYVKLSMSEPLEMKQAPDLYESPSFLVKFNNSWSPATAAILTLKTSGEKTKCKLGRL